MIFKKDKNDEDNYIDVNQEEDTPSNDYDLNNILINKVGTKSTPL